MIRLTAIFYSLTFVFCIHLQSQQNKATIKDVLNAACPYLPTAYITNLDSNWIYGGIDPALYKNKVQELRNGNKVVKCLPKKPYSNGVECINCDRNEIFNLNTKSCEHCPQGTQYNLNERKCTIKIDPNVKISYFTDFDHQNLVTKERSFQQLKRQNEDKVASIPQSQKRMCNSATPFFNGVDCISCPLDQPYFDLEKLSCVSPQNGTKYSASTHKFVKIKFLISPDSPNLLYGKQSADAYRARFNSQKSNSTICPSETPYFNGQNCISCSSQNPLFDLDTLQCIHCPLTKIYEPSQGKCINKINVHPTIQRYLMNIK